MPNPNSVVHTNTPCDISLIASRFIRNYFQFKFRTVAFLGNFSRINPVSKLDETLSAPPSLTIFTGLAQSESISGSLKTSIMRLPSFPPAFAAAESRSACRADMDAVDEKSTITAHLRHGFEQGQHRVVEDRKV
jgi:hypothetical protein